ncbi:MAG: DUF4838 domain-containing protein, partial [Planctomycetales bacterium]|nr:DUF4838 domain-containing protein [Planctomycetales bacterium]
MHPTATVPKDFPKPRPHRAIPLHPLSPGEATGLALGMLLALGLLPTLSAQDTLAPAEGPRHHLVRDGRSLAMIVLPAQPEMLEGQAAAELQRYVREITGRTLPILNEPAHAEGFGAYNEPQKLDGYGIWLGRTQAAESAQFTLTEERLGRDGYAAQADDKGLVVVGRCPLGTLFGVYDIIEREFGVRWFVPDEQQRILTPQREQIWVEQDPIGAVVPRADSLSVGTFRKEFKPSFEHRWVREGTWALRNRMNVWVKVNGQTVGVNYKWYGHTITALIPPHEHFAEHPEWFALVQGKRQGRTDPEGLGHDAQLCTSNPEVVEKLAQRLIETIEAEPTIEVISLSPNDGGGFCECENCTALDGPPRKPEEPSEQAAEKNTDSAGVTDGQPQKAARKPTKIVPWKYSNRFAILHNEVARRVAKRFPKVKIKVFAYGYYVLPPDIPDFRVEPNLLVQVVGTGAIRGIPGTIGERTKAVISQWSKLTDELGVYKAYAVAAWGKAQVMRSVVHEIREDIPSLRDQGVKMFFTQYMQQPWTQCPLNHYIAAKLVWNADLDVDWLIADYCEKFFESSAEPMHAYLMEIERVSSRYAELGMEAYDPTTLEKLRALLEQARSQADSEVVHKRIAAIRTAFDACEQSVLRATKASSPPAAPPAPPAAPPNVNAQSASGLNFYSQGGVVVDGIAYFTANDHCAQPGNVRTEDFPCVVAIDLETYQVVRRYDVSFTYDSSPVVFPNSDGEWLVAAHEYKKSRTVALNRDSGQVAWRSPSNQPGAY